VLDSSCYVCFVLLLRHFSANLIVPQTHAETEKYLVVLGNLQWFYTLQKNVINCCQASVLDYLPSTHNKTKTVLPFLQNKQEYSTKKQKSVLENDKKNLRKCFFVILSLKAALCYMQVVYAN